jgi:hypothetical protein
VVWGCFCAGGVRSGRGFGAGDDVFCYVCSNGSGGRVSFFSFPSLLTMAYEPSLSFYTDSLPRALFLLFLHDYVYLSFTSYIIT